MKNKLMIILLAIGLGFIAGWIIGPVLEHLSSNDFFEGAEDTRAVATQPPLPLYQSARSWP